MEYDGAESVSASRSRCTLKQCAPLGELGPPRCVLPRVRWSGGSISKLGPRIKMMPSPGSGQSRGRSCVDRVSDTTSDALSVKPGEQRAEFSLSQPVQESPTSAHSFSRVGPATVRAAEGAMEWGKH